MRSWRLGLVARNALFFALHHPHGVREGHQALDFISFGRRSRIMVRRSITNAHFV